ncbi:hypothetical protein LMG33810_002389 [Carnimonas sp. LMG 33810]
MHALNSANSSANELMQIAAHMMRQSRATLIGLTLACLTALCAACAPEPVYSSIQAPAVSIPHELTQPLTQPKCRIVVNSDLGGCILKQRDVIDRANADRAAVERALTQQVSK